LGEVIAALEEQYAVALQCHAAFVGLVLEQHAQLMANKRINLTARR
jgi:hypothetical protein